MKNLILSLMALLCLMVCGNAQTVKTLGFNTTNNRVIGPTNQNPLIFTNNLNLPSNVRVNALTTANFIYGGVGGVLEVEANNNHAIVARAPDITDATAFYGYSSSGASVAKLVQDTNFTSPALTVWRPSTVPNKESAAVLIVDTKAPDNTNTALEIRAETTSIFTVNFQGNVSANAATFADSNTTRTNLGLSDAQISPQFPTESDGTRRVRYPFGNAATSAAASTQILTNTISILPFFVDAKTTNFSAYLPTLACVNPVVVKVAVYSASGGLRSANKLEEASITIISNTAPVLAKEVTFTNAGKTLERGWYVLAAFHTGTNRITNSGNFAINTIGMLGTATPVGSLNASCIIVTNTTNFPTSFTNTPTSISNTAVIWAMPFH